MPQIRVVIFAEGLALPLIIPLDHLDNDLPDRLRRFFARSPRATHAEVWDGSRKILQVAANRVEREGFDVDVGAEPLAPDPTLH